MLSRIQSLGLALTVAALAGFTLGTNATAQSRSDEAGAAKGFLHTGSFKESGSMKYYTRLIDPPTVYSPRTAGEMEALDPSQKAPPAFERTDGTADAMRGFRPGGPEQAADDGAKAFADIVLRVDGHTKAANIRVGATVQVSLTVDAWKNKHFLQPPRWILEIELNGTRQLIAVSGLTASFEAPALAGATLRLRAHTDEGASDNSVLVRIVNMGGTQ